MIGGTSFSDDGNRAVYQIGGGTPLSDSGSAFTLYFSERSASGWQSRTVIPPRNEAVGSSWLAPAGSRDLLNLVTPRRGDCFLQQLGSSVERDE